MSYSVRAASVAAKHETSRKGKCLLVPPPAPREIYLGTSKTRDGTLLDSADNVCSDLKYCC